MRISAVVCTRDRHRLLADTLASLAGQTLAPERYEVVVVDNASTDATPAVAEAAGRATGNLRYVHEPRLGLSHARNRGVAESTGELVAFIDDDAVADPGWLEALSDAFDAAPGCAAVGGRVALEWPGPRPAWLAANLVGYFSGLDLGPERRVLVPPLRPFGTNMSLRAAVLVALGGFSPDLGRRGDDLLSEEETELFHRVRREGGLVLYEPRARVVHRVGTERVSRRWVLARAFAQGRSRVVVDRLVDGSPAPRALAGRALGDLGRAAGRGNRALVGGLLGRDSARVMQSAAHRAFWCGHAWQCAREAWAGRQ